MVKNRKAPDAWKLMNEELIVKVQEVKTAVAKKLGVREEILIPVDTNLLVEDLERENEEKDAIIASLDAEIRKRDAELRRINAKLAKKTSKLQN